MKIIAAILWLSALAFGYQQYNHGEYGFHEVEWDGSMANWRCINDFDIVLPDGREVFGHKICLESHSDAPLHFGYMGNGVFIYDEDGNVYPLTLLPVEHPQVEEFNYGVH